MRPLLFVPYYLRWHYFDAQKKIFRLTENYLWFVWNLFSIGLLFRTLFAPWQREVERQKTGFDIEALGSKLIINGIVRIVGAFIRLIVIAAGLLFIAAGIICSIAVYIVWLIMPALVIFLFLLGIFLLFKTH